MAFGKHLIEETGLPTCVFSARGARPVRVCVTLPGLDCAPQMEARACWRPAHSPPEERAGGQAPPALCLAAISRPSLLLDPHMGYAAGTLYPRPDPDPGSAHPQEGAAARPSRPLAGMVAELRTMLPRATLSGEQSPHPSSPLPALCPGARLMFGRTRRRKPLGIFHLNEFLGRKHNVYKVETIHGTKY